MVGCIAHWWFVCTTTGGLPLPQGKLQFLQSCNAYWAAELQCSLLDYRAAELQCLLGFQCPLGCSWMAGTYWQCALLVGRVSDILVGQVAWKHAWPAIMVHILLVCKNIILTKLHKCYVSCCLYAVHRELLYYFIFGLIS